MTAPIARWENEGGAVLFDTAAYRVRRPRRHAEVAERTVPAREVENEMTTRLRPCPSPTKLEVDREETR